MLKRYYTLQEAAEFLSSAAGAPLKNRDIFDLARRREIRVCTYVSGKPATICDYFGQRCDVGKDSFSSMSLHAYIVLDPFFVDRNMTFPIFVDQVYQVCEYLERPERKLLTQDFRFIEGTLEAFERELELPCFWTFFKAGNTPAAVESPETAVFEIDYFEIAENDIVIPAEDLLGFGRKGAARLGTGADRNELAGKSKTSVLQLVGGLLMDAYRMDIHADRLSGISDVQNDLARVGITMDEKTLRRWIKEAAQVIEPPKSKP